MLLWLALLPLPFLAAFTVRASPLGVLALTLGLLLIVARLPCTLARLFRLRRNPVAQRLGAAVFLGGIDALGHGRADQRLVHMGQATALRALILLLASLATLSLAMSLTLLATTIAALALLLRLVAWITFTRLLRLAVVLTRRLL